MSDSISVIPANRQTEALELLVSSLPAEAHRQQILAIQSQLDSDPLQAAGLLGWFRGNWLGAVCWLQTQRGRVATLWPPRWSRAEDRAITAALISGALQIVEQNHIVLAQSLLCIDAAGDAAALRDARFSHIADVLYLACLSDCFPQSQGQRQLEFVALPSADDTRIKRMIQRSYDGTKDCPALDGIRSIDDIVEGYRAVGRYRPELWFIARLDNEDIGCALLADHSPEPAWELMYMGVSPDVRGRGLGYEITRHAQWLASRENVERLLLAVDASNHPALAMYAQAGFEIWDRRSVFARVFRDSLQA